MPILTRSLSAGTAQLVPGRGTEFVPHSDRWVAFHVDVDMGNTMTLGDRMEPLMREALVVELGVVAKAIIEHAKAKLQPIPKDANGKHTVITPDGNIYGLDTGLMRDTLTAMLVDASIAGAETVAYDLLSDQAEYWVWVEFGHMLRNGVWWPGYHFLSSSVDEMAPAIMQAIGRAWSTVLTALAQEARIPI